MSAAPKELREETTTVVGMASGVDERATTVVEVGGTSRATAARILEGTVVEEDTETWIGARRTGGGIGRGRDQAAGRGPEGKRGELNP